MLTQWLAAQQPAAQSEDLFDSQEVLALDLWLDMAELQADRGKEVDYHAAELRYLVGSDTVSLATQVKARGHFRRQPQICAMPPLKLKFSRKAREGTLFAQQDELKLVCHCRGDEYVLREYLLYRVYDLVADYNLRVRLARITYRDQGGQLPPETHLAFFLEHQDVADDRLHVVQLEGQQLRPQQVDPDNLVLVSLFSYLIGNADWDVLLEKNLRIFQIPGRSRPILVPYDFDWSGAVGASYTGLGADYPYRKLKGPYADLDCYRRWLSHLLARQEMILDVYRNCDLFENNKARREATAFVQTSLALMASPAFWAEIEALVGAR
jgi:hypothetical protein